MRRSNIGSEQHENSSLAVGEPPRVVVNGLDPVVDGPACAVSPAEQVKGLSEDFIRVLEKQNAELSKNVSTRIAMPCIQFNYSSKPSQRRCGSSRRNAKNGRRGLRFCKSNWRS